MSRMQVKVVGTLSVLLATAAMTPSISFAQADRGPYERTATELGQAIGEPGEQDSAATALYARTPTELGQRVASSAAPDGDSSGFDWGDAAIGGGAVLALGAITLGGVALASRRTHLIRRPSSPAVSS